jgi:cell division protein FtsB
MSIIGIKYMKIRSVNLIVTIRRRILISLFAGLSVYLVTMLIWGESGIETYRELSSYRGELEKNLAELDGIGQELRQNINELQTSKDRIILEARRIQYFRPGDKIVRVDGWNGQNQTMTPGRLLMPRKTQTLPTALFRAVAVCTSFVTFIFIGMANPFSYRRRVQTASRE